MPTPMNKLLQLVASPVYQAYVVIGCWLQALAIRLMLS